MQGRFPHWQGQSKTQWGKRPGSTEVDLSLVAPAAALGEEWGVCLSSGHWGWCGLSELPCPSGEGSRALISANWAPTVSIAQ